MYRHRFLKLIISTYRYIGNVNVKKKKKNRARHYPEAVPSDDTRRGPPKTTTGPGGRERKTEAGPRLDAIVSPCRLYGSSQMNTKLSISRPIITENPSGRLSPLNYLRSARTYTKHGAEGRDIRATEIYCRPTTASSSDGRKQ